MMYAGTNENKPSPFPYISFGVYFSQHPTISDYNFMEQGCGSFGHEVENLVER